MLFKPRRYNARPFGFCVTPRGPRVGAEKVSGSAEVSRREAPSSPAGEARRGGRPHGRLFTNPVTLVGVTQGAHGSAVIDGAKRAVYTQGLDYDGPGGFT